MISNNICIEMMSENINELAAALSAAQGEIEGAVKDSANPYFKSKYADLHAVKEACREPLAKNGLSVVQPTHVIDGKTCLVTMLMHKSGQWIKGILPLVASKQDCQAIGSSMTYFRRYAFCSMIGVSQFDDDGEASMDRTKNVVKSHSNAPTIDDLCSKLSTVAIDHDRPMVEGCVRNMAQSYKTSEPVIVTSAMKDATQLSKFVDHLEEYKNAVAKKVKGKQ